MKPKAKRLLGAAKLARARLKAGQISREQAAEIVSKFVEFFNQRSVIISKKYGLKPKKISVAGFLR
jgi:hypothetical protein